MITDGSSLGSWCPGAKLPKHQFWMQKHQAISSNNTDSKPILQKQSHEKMVAFDLSTLESKLIYLKIGEKRVDLRIITYQNPISKSTYKSAIWRFILHYVWQGSHLGMQLDFRGTFQSTLENK